MSSNEAATEKAAAAPSPDPESPNIDLASYLERIGFDAPPGRDLATLRGLHAAHQASIPFENVDVRLGRVPALDLESLQQKLVRRRRGGYCFEQNTLFAAVLRSLGFTVQTLEARVRPPGVTIPMPRTHMILRVEADERWWLADVGFGGEGPSQPVPFEGEPPEGTGEAFAIAREPEGVHVLRRHAGGGCNDVYAFTLVPALAIDFEVANHYTATYSRSPFVKTLTVQGTDGDRRVILRGRTLWESGPAGNSVRELGPDEIVALVIDELGLELTPQELLKALE